MGAAAFGGAGKETRGITDLGWVILPLAAAPLHPVPPRMWDGAAAVPPEPGHPARAESTIREPELNEWLAVYTRVINKVHFQSLWLQSLRVSRGIQQVRCDSSSARAEIQPRDEP